MSSRWTVVLVVVMPPIGVAVVIDGRCRSAVVLRNVTALESAGDVAATVLTRISRRAWPCVTTASMPATSDRLVAAVVRCKRTHPLPQFVTELVVPTVVVGGFGFSAMLYDGSCTGAAAGVSNGTLRMVIVSPNTATDPNPVKLGAATPASSKSRRRAMPRIRALRIVFARIRARDVAVRRPHICSDRADDDQADDHGDHQLDQRQTGAAPARARASSARSTCRG